MINFSEQELKKMSEEYLSFDDIRANFEKNKADNTSLVESLRELDLTNKKWTDFYLDNIAKYHLELRHLTSKNRATYSGEPSIIDGSQRGLIHFPLELPDNVWKNFQPKVLESNNGQPVLTVPSETESQRIVKIYSSKDMLISGYSDGNASSLTTSSFNEASREVDAQDVTIFTIGQRVVLRDDSNALIGTIEQITQSEGSCSGEMPTGSGTSESLCSANGGEWTAPKDGIIRISLIKQTGAIGVGLLSNYISPIAESERNISNGSTKRQSVIVLLQSILIDSMNSWKSLLFDVVRPVIQSNSDIKNKSYNKSEIESISSMNDSLTIWKNSPLKFNNSNLANITSLFSSRMTISTLRIQKIKDCLGQVSQLNNGKFSGVGCYYDLFTWINKRCNAASGSLSKVSGTSNSIDAVDSQIDDLVATKAEVESIMIVRKITQDGDGSNLITVDNAVGLSLEDEIKIISSTQSILVCEITAIEENRLSLSKNVSSEYSISNNLRLIKEY